MHFTLTLRLALSLSILTQLPSSLSQENKLTLPAPIGIPAPGPTNDSPYAPQPILQGGRIIPLYPPGSPFLNQKLGLETKAAKDIEAFLKTPERRSRAR